MQSALTPPCALTRILKTIQGNHYVEQWCSVDAFLPGSKKGGSDGSETGDGVVGDKEASLVSRPGVSPRRGEDEANTYDLTLSSNADEGANKSSQLAATSKGSVKLKASTACLGGAEAKKSRGVGGPGMPTPFTSVDNQHQSNNTSQRFPQESSTPPTASSKPTRKSSTEVAGLKRSLRIEKQVKSVTNRPLDATTQSRDDIDLPSGVSQRASGKWQVQVDYKCRWALPCFSCCLQSF